MGKYKFRISPLDIICHLYPNDPVDASILRMEGDERDDYDIMEWKCDLPKPTEEELYQAELACIQCRGMEMYRQWRNDELKNTDAKVLMKDFPISEEERKQQLKYRQILRDSPEWVMVRFNDEKLEELDMDYIKFQLNLKMGQVEDISVNEEDKVKSEINYLKQSNQLKDEEIQTLRSKYNTLLDTIETIQSKIKNMELIQSIQ